MRGWNLTAMSILLLACACAPEEDVSPPIENPETVSRSLKAIPLYETRPRFPLYWRVSEIDSRFGLSSDEVGKAMERAVKVWEIAAHKELFARGSAGFPVRLVFDRRQERLNGAREAKRSLAMQEKSLRLAKAVTDEADERFARAQSALRADFETRNASVNDYNRRVQTINASGGAKAAESEELEALKASITEADGSLEYQKHEVDTLRTQARNLADNYNQLVARHNESVKEFNRQFGGAIEETIGECRTTGNVPDQITIYSFDTLEHLAVVLAHELGHALGVEHVKGEGALMSAVEKGLHGAKGLRLTERDRDALRLALGK